MAVRDPELLRLAQNLTARFARAPRPVDLGAVGLSREFGGLYRHLDSAGLVDKFGFSKTDSSGKLVRADASDLLHWYVGPFLRDCLGDLSGPNAGFRRFYPAFEESLLADASMWLFLAPLSNFRATREHIEVLPDVSIRLLSSDEREKLSEILGRLAPGSPLGRQHVYGMAVKQLRPKGAPTLGFGKEMFFAPLTALRLIKPGDVQMGVPALREVEVGLEWVQGPPYGTIVPPGQQLGSGMTIRGGGVVFSLWRIDHGLLAALTRCMQSDVARNVLTALERFNLSYERTQATDRIIDYWVALEALFLPGSEDEKSYRVALRLAYFAGDSSKKRTDVYQQARESYRARSWLVHGQQEGKKKRKRQFDFERIARETGDLLRRALRLVVLNPGEPNIDRLEEAVVNGKRYLVGRCSSRRRGKPAPLSRS